MKSGVRASVFWAGRTMIGRKIRARTCAPKLLLLPEFSCQQRTKSAATSAVLFRRAVTESSVVPTWKRVPHCGADCEHHKMIRVCGERLGCDLVRVSLFVLRDKDWVCLDCRRPIDDPTSKSCFLVIGAWSLAILRTAGARRRAPEIEPFGSRRRGCNLGRVVPCFSACRWLAQRGPGHSVARRMAQRREASNS